ncbi:hypothetical protein JCM11251_000552 [Rhodosporidiobolus azoricus]
MHTAGALAALLAAAQAVSAFKGTYPVVAWSSERLTALAQLSPSASSSSSSRSSSSNKQQQTFSTSVESSDLCSISTLLVLSAPGLHYSDLSLLPSASSSPAGVKSALAHFGADETEGSAATHPYAPLKGANRAAQLVRRFVGECGASVQTEGEANVWAGEAGKIVKLVKVDGLEQWELVGLEAREGRKQVMSEIDSAISSLTTSLPSPFAVILTSLPSTFSPSHPVSAKKGMRHHGAAAAAKKAKLAKRQAPADADAAEEEYLEELLDEIAKEDALDDMIEKMDEFEESKGAATAVDDGLDAAPVVSDEYTADGGDLGVTDVAEPASAQQPGTIDELAQEEALADESYDGEYSADDWLSGEGSVLEVGAMQKNGSGNGTSIFQPKEGSGLLHRYVFFTPSLIFCFLVGLLVLIPTLLVGTQALLSIETVQGLETKMTGTVGLDASKQ